MLSGLSLPALRAFTAVVDFQSVTRAAAYLETSQSAVSHHIKGLEAYSGQALFIRQRNAYTPTDAGRTLYNDVREALAILASAERKLVPASSGRFIIGTQYSYGLNFLLPLWAEMEAAFTGTEFVLDIQIEEDADPKGAFDLCIGHWPPTEAYIPFSETRPLFRPFAAPQLASADPLGAEGAGPLITFEEGSDWRSWGVPHADDRHFLSITAIGLAIEAARLGLGVVLAPDFLVRRDVEAGRLIALSNHGVPFSWAPLNISGSRHSEKIELARELGQWLAGRAGLKHYS